MKRLIMIAALLVAEAPLAVMVAKKKSNPDIVVNCNSEGCSGDHGDDKKKD